MIVSRPVAWSLILLTLLGSSLIRQLHEYIPQWTPLPWPIRSPLYAFLVLIFLLLLASSARRDHRPRTGVEPGVHLAALTPLLIALVYEKVLSITLYEAMLDHAVRVESIRNHLDAWLHILIGLGMTVAVLLLVPLMGRVGFRNFLTAAQVRSGLYLQFFALALTYALVAGMAVLLGGGRQRPTLLFPVGTVPLLLVIGQGVRAMAEEFYYRGLLQRELTGLMFSLGVPDSRTGRTAAIALISLGFGIEHFRFGGPILDSYQAFAYAVAVGFLFGYLLVLTGNVFFCGLVHATNNYVTANVLPKLGTSDGSLLVPDETILYLYLVVIFLLVFLAGGLSRGSLRQALLPDAGRPVKT